MQRRPDEGEERTKKQERDRMRGRGWVRGRGQGDPFHLQDR